MITCQFQALLQHQNDQNNQNQQRIQIARVYKAIQQYQIWAAQCINIKDKKSLKAEFQLKFMLLRMKYSSYLLFLVIILLSELFYGNTYPFWIYPFEFIVYIGILMKQFGLVNRQMRQRKPSFRFYFSSLLIYLIIFLPLYFANLGFIFIINSGEKVDKLSIFLIQFIFFALEIIFFTAYHQCVAFIQPKRWWMLITLMTIYITLCGCGVIRFSVGINGSYQPIYTIILCLAQVHTFLLRMSTVLYFQDPQSICFIDGWKTSKLVGFLIGCCVMLFYLFFIFLYLAHKRRAFKKNRQIKIEQVPLNRERSSYFRMQENQEQENQEHLIEIGKQPQQRYYMNRFSPISIDQKCDSDRFYNSRLQFGYPNLTVQQALTYAGQFYCLEKNRIEKKVNALLFIFSLNRNRKQKIQNLSQGQQKKTLMAMEFMASKGCFYFQQPLKNIDIYSSIQMKVFFYCMHRNRNTPFTVHCLIKQESDFFNKQIFMSIFDGSQQQIEGDDNQN